MKTIVFLIAVILFPSFLALASTNDIRNVRWGMSPQEVIRAENNTTIETQEGYIQYNVTLNGLDALLIYEFAFNKLVNAMWTIRDSDFDMNSCISKYDSFKLKLTEKYGTPSVSRDIWRNDLFRDNPSQWNTALVLGQYSKVTAWTNSRTEIKFYITGKDTMPSMSLIYGSRQFKDLLKEKERQEEEARDKKEGF